ncbi:MAG: HAD family phosphatase [Verrucomicrobiae bacterium]|nr:HAD family phosphatase [Verrucomicrobiae bacterium]
MKPAAVIFDLGKVLLDFDYSITARALAGQCAVPAEELRLHIDQSPLLLRYESGEMTTEEFYRTVREAAGYRGNYETFREAFGGIFAEIPPMVDLQRRLKDAGVHCYIFSNTNEVAIHHVKRNFPFFAGFDGYVYSHIVGAMKPAAKIYEAVEALVGLRGADLLYIDDREENIVAGRERGWHAVHHTAPATTIAAVEGSGLLPT